MKKIFLFFIIIFLLSGCSKSESESDSASVFSDTGNSPNNSTDSGSGITESISETSKTSDTDHNTEPIFDELDDFNSREMILSRDPKNFLKASFDENKITVSGKKRGENSYISIYLEAEDAQKFNYFGHFNIDLDEENIIAEYDFSELPEGGYTVTIDFIEDENWNYYELPVHKSADKIAPEDNSETAKNNSDRANSAIISSDRSVSEYIFPGGNTEEIIRVLSEIKTLSNEICEGITDDYEKLRAISQWVSGNIYYDLDALTADGFSADVITLDFVLKNKRSLCGGFSNITAALCAAQGIECYNVHGIKIKNTETLESPEANIPHECNIAVINGRGIWVDTLWNSYNSHINGVYKKGGQTGTKYFDVSGAFFAYEYKVTFCEFRNYFGVIR